MANGLIEKKNLEDIAAAIRVKNGLTTKYKPSEMANAIMEIKVGGNVIISEDVQEVTAVGGNLTINIPKATGITEVGDYILGQTKSGADYDVAVYKVTAVDDTDADNYVCSVEVQSNLEVIGVDSSDATALASDIMSGKSAYVNNVKVDGALTALSSKELEASGVSKTNGNIVLSLTNDLTSTQIINSTSTVTAKVAESDVATNYAVTADKIKVGESVLGVTGTFTSDANAVATDIVDGKIAYVNGVKVTGTFQGKDSSDANASATDVLSGKTAYINNEKVTGTMANNGALSYTPSTSEQTIPAGYTSGGTIAAVTASIDPNITADKIKTGVEILGVTGTFTSDANATAADIISGKTAYVNGTKITGSQALTEADYSFTATATDDSVNNKIKVESAALANTIAVASGNKLTTTISYADLAALIGLTADKIKEGETILGITGTYGFEDLNEVQF